MAPIEPKQKSLEAIPTPSNTSGKNEQTTKLDQKLERLSSVAHTSILALNVWEDTDAAITWLSRPNQSLNGQIPLVLCETESGMKQVQRVLHALEWGNST